MLAEATAVLPYLEQRVLRHAQSPAGFQEVRNVFHLLEWHPRLVHPPHGSRLDRIDQLYEDSKARL